MTKNKWIIMAGIIAIGSIVGITSLLSARATSSEDNAVSTRPVKAVAIAPMDFLTSQEYAGFVRGAEQSTVAAKINGRIVSIIKREGSIVRKGEVIAILSAEDVTAQTQSAQNTVSALQKTLKSTEKYYKQKVDEAKKGSATKEEIQSAKRLRDLQIQSMKSEIVSAQGSLQVAQSFARETEVRAPFDGIVTRVFQEVGQVVGPAMPICEVANQKHLSIDVFVAEEMAAQIAKGDVVAVLCENEQEECTGEVFLVGPVSDVNAQQALVRIQFKANDPLIHLGQYVTVKFPSSADMQNKLVITEQAVIARYDDTFVFVVEDGVAKERQVTLGQVQNGMVEIMSGVVPGELVVTQGMHDLRNNDKITIYE